MKNLRSEIESVLDWETDPDTGGYGNAIDKLESLFKERENAIIGEDESTAYASHKYHQHANIRNNLRREQRELLKDE